MSKLNILFVVRKLDVGGMERLVIDLIMNLDPAKYNPILCTIEDPGQLAPQLERGQIEVIALNKPPGLSIKTVFLLRSLIKEKHIDLIHSHNSTGHFYAAFANLSLLKRRGFVHTKHGRGTPELKKSVLRNMLSSALTNVVVPVSDDVGLVCHDIEKVPKRKLHTIINGVDVDPYVDAAKNRVVSKEVLHFGHVGRLHAIKNQVMMIRVFASFLKEFPDSTLTFVGDGPLRDNLKTLCAELGIQEKVIFLGYRSDIPKLTASFDCFLMSSLSEGTPLVLIEAMAAKCPVIGTDVGGMKEVVIDGENGFLVPSRDERAFLERMLYLANHVEEAVSMGAKGQERAVTDYRMSSMVVKYQEVYDSLCEFRGC